MSERAPPLQLPDFFEGVLTACPWFKEPWKAYCAEWSQPEAPGAYNLSDQVVAFLEKLAPESIPALNPLAESMEILLRDGDEETRDAVAIGLLEGIHDSMERAPRLASTLVPLLGPVGHQAWDNVVRNNGNFRSEQFKAERIGQ